jgi:kinesin family protein 5
MSNPSECGIQVFCRVRPLNEIEKKNGSTFLPKIQGKDSITVAGKTYVYDQVFDEKYTQESVYQGAAYHIVQDVLTGYNGTVFAYGQTSSGKTHTMEGVIGDPEKQGIIPRIINDIFNHIYNMDDTNLEFHIKVSYYEIYNEKIRDLLDYTKTNLPIHEDKNRVPYVKGVTEHFVASPEEVLAAIEEGKNNRQVAVTNMNEHSSRSHSVFQIQVEQENKATQKKLTGKLYLVDLAGSEKVSKTGAEGAVLEEAKNINKSLSALGNVISALAEGTKTHVPYRDSKLTRILQESLGGNSRTTIVICCSPASWNEGETKSTLLFGSRAKTIKNVVVVNEELTAEEWKRLYEREKDKVAKLKAQLLHYVGIIAELKRFRSGERVPESEWVNLNEIDAAQLTESTLMTPSMSESVFVPTAPAPQPLLSSTTGPMSDEERRKYEEERSKLYQQLDEKDDEIQVQSQLVEKLKQQANDADDINKQSQQEHTAALNEIARLQEENGKYREETDELFSAIQEVAMNLEQKKTEVDTLTRENDRLSEDFAKRSMEFIEYKAKIDELNEILANQKRKICESVQSMLREFGELGSNYPIPEKFVSDAIDIEKPLDEEMLAHARICISKLTTDYKSALQKASELQNGSGDVEKRLDASEKELSDCRLQIQQLDAKNKSLQETIDSQEKAKRSLEDELDALNSRLASSGGVAGEALNSDQQKVVAQLRDQITEKNNQIKSLNESLQELQLAKEKLTQDYEKLRNDETEKEKKYKEFSALSDKREQAKQDLRGLEETVQKELQSLQNLRKLFVQDLSQRIRKVPVDGEEEFLSSPAQKQKIQFLESNLDQLTKVHKQLVRDNAELRLELPKLEKRLRATMDRTKLLETALRETKENSMRDRRKYAMEVERIKEAVRRRNMARRNPQIARPIRPGQHYPPSTTPSRPSLPVAES